MSSERASCASFRRRAALAAGLLALALGCGREEPPPGAGAQPAASARVPAAAAAGRPERIVLVSIDTLRADRIGAWGAADAETPTLDALAARGARFAQAISPTPLTLPSHTSLLTARDPWAHGVHHNGVYRLGPEHPTLAERLREAGFATAAFVSAYVLDRSYGLERGFDHYDDQLALRGPGRGAISVPERSADRTVAAVEEWLARAPDRFFLFVHFYDPHAEYAPPPPWDHRFRGRLYDGEVAFADAQLGRLLAAIEARHPDRATLIAVTSDHGESLGEHGEPTHSYGLYDATQHVPLLLAGPGVPAGLVVDAQVRLVDVAPTLLALAGAPPLAHVEGRSLAPLLSGAEEPERVAYLETLAPRFDHGWSPLFALRSGGWKYVRAPRPELYALASDPGETRNLAQDEPERLAALSARLDALLADAPPAAAPGALDPRARARLAALGYLIGEPGDQELPLGVVDGADPKDGMPVVAALHDANRLLVLDQPAQAKARLDAVSGGGWMLYQMRAMAAQMLGDLSAARADADAAVAAAPDSSDAHMLLASVCLQSGDYDCAERALERAASLAPGSGGVLAARGVLAEQRGELAEAEQLYRAALAARAPARSATWQLAALLIERGARDEAFTLLGEAPPEELTEVMAALRLALAEDRTGHDDLARLRLEGALRRHPRSLPLLRAVAPFRDAAGDRAGARRALEAALELAPNDAQLCNDLAFLLAREGRDLDRALELARQAIAQLGRRPVLLDTLATVLVRRGEHEEALRVIAEARPGADPELAARLDELEREARTARNQASAP